MDFFELQDLDNKCNTLNEKQINCIKEHLALVFENVTEEKVEDKTKEKSSNNLFDTIRPIRNSSNSNNRRIC